MTMVSNGTNENPSKQCENDASRRKTVVQNNDTGGFSASHKTTARGDDNDNDNLDVDEMMDIRVPSGMMLFDDSDGGGGGGGNGVVEKSQPTKTMPLKPAENLRVDDRAILDCWNLTVASHEAVAIASDVSNTATTDLSSASSPTSSSPSPVSLDALLNTKYRWNAADEAPATIADVGAGAAGSAFDLLESWKPKPLALPVWAVDPFETEVAPDN
mmetsp:Transcript_16416/g.45300  ORF Transcript_16416/g.45300 Transcript_16416/m.45300 type:complete len:215 (+) Transcript_16416:129-773(+)|eukprot:CAMPEP_0172372676 /NCGR_PEP_ID=MMETSP1060-20121228/48713_1 /TAXON_ID=37318 /ORGANISM="Pseudo-nitzschia pungens, Strain cf. cingulata" /LENGTH=214 /DNA_ID=CAMNT_0013098771 /DNA_START=122 /DNA_END=766 /DNA_ORIENTATION=+